MPLQKNIFHVSTQASLGSILGVWEDRELIIGPGVNYIIRWFIRAEIYTIMTIHLIDTTNSIYTLFLELIAMLFVSQNGSKTFCFLWKFDTNVARIREREAISHIILRRLSI